jgi:5'-3' exonuclease
VLLILDGNNLAWAGFHALRRPLGAYTPERKERAALLGLAQAVFGILNRVGEPPDGRPGGQGRLLNVATPVSGLAIAFDEGRPLRRRSIYPRYQTGREGDPSFVENEPHILAAIGAFVELARALPVEVLRGENTEADDLIAARALAEPGPVRIASTDRDFLQLVDERLSIYSPVKKLVVDAENFVEHAAPRDAAGVPVAFPRERYLDYRVASGDSSDDLPGVPGVGALTAARLLAEAPLDAYLEDPARAATVLGRRNAKLEAALGSGEAREVVARNRALMDLRAAAAHYPSLAPYRAAGSWDDDTLRAWLDEQRAFGIEREATLAAFERLAEATATRERR